MQLSPRISHRGSLLRRSALALTLLSLAAAPVRAQLPDAGRPLVEGEFVVWMTSPSVAQEQARARAEGRALDMPAWRDQLRAEQDRFMERWQGRGEMRVIGQIQMVMNAMILELDPQMREAMAEDPDVVRITPVELYTLHLAESVPVIGASELQRVNGLDGTGVRVAVLDTGVDYMHAALGGPGTDEAYQAAIADTRDRAGLFPTEKVVDGFDFTGPDFPEGPVSQDPDPIDRQGHGTNVADIMAGRLGVAPEAKILAVKVCAETQLVCNGGSILRGIEFAVDPNGDGDPSDRADVMNLSFGSEYGPADGNPSVAALEGAAALGTLAVVSAGNSGDQPFVLSQPASAPSAIAVAQTQIVSAERPAAQITPARGAARLAPAQAATFAAPLNRALSGPVQYGDGAGAGLDGCNLPDGSSPFASGSLAGRIVLVDRGSCAFVEKVQNVEAAGGIFTVIGQIAPGPLVTPGGDANSGIPAVAISQVDSDPLRAGGGQISVGPDQGISLAQSMVASSSRGPQLDTGDLKPEIGAPGALLSARFGSGTGTRRFSGTSGAAPVVAGSAALLMQANPDRSPLEIKAMLVQAAESEIRNDVPGDLAPVSRIGGGEVRVNRAFSLPAIALDSETQQPTLAFGALDVADRSVQLQRTLEVRSLSSEPVRLRIRQQTRFDDDARSGAVRIRTRPQALQLAPGASATVEVEMTIDGARLPNPSFDSGEAFTDPAALTRDEFDGYLELAVQGQDAVLRVPWQVMPRKAARLVAEGSLETPQAGQSARVSLRNTGMGMAQNDAFALLFMISPQDEGRGADAGVRAVGARTLSQPTDVCSSGFALEFAFNTEQRQRLLLRARLGAVLDVDGDGEPDFLLTNANRSAIPGGIGAGQISLVRPLGESEGEAAAAAPAPAPEFRFFAGHASRTANTTLRACGEQIGLSAADLGTRRVGLAVESISTLTGAGVRVQGITLVPGALGLDVSVPDIAPQGRGTLEVRRTPVPEGIAPPLGVMVFSNGSRPESTGGATAETEALLLPLR